jgi:hypothetical protein
MPVISMPSAGDQGRHVLRLAESEFEHQRSRPRAGAEFNRP